MFFERLKRLKIQAIEWEEIFSNYISDKGLAFGRPKELSDPIVQNNSIKNWTKDIERYSTEEDKWIAISTWKDV